MLANRLGRRLDGSARPSVQVTFLSAAFMIASLLAVIITLVSIDVAIAAEPAGSAEIGRSPAMQTR